MNRGHDYAINGNIKTITMKTQCSDVILRILRKVLYFGTFFTHCDTRNMETKNRWEGSELQRSSNLVRQNTCVVYNQLVTIVSKNLHMVHSQ